MEALTERTPRVVSAVKLHRGAERRKTGRFLVEGENAVAEALHDARVHDVFVTADAAQRYAAVVAAARKRGVRVSTVTDKAARALSDTVTPPGVVAVADVVDVPVEDALTRGARLVAVPVGVGEPGNAGTLVRVSDAVGADGIVFAGDSVDPHNGKAVRSSAGSLFHLPVVRERDVDAVLDALHGSGFTVLATTVDGEIELDDADELLAQPTAWLFGSEAHGLPPDLAARADHRVRIPIRGRAESLNLATAASICLYSSARVQARAARAENGS
ncbi:RNA methyltransferase [Rhodococcus sp. HNM0569]|uniref:TrmH family RNA methyltransferase n=1 Tax=Rhodococcus sp. HNM0569 TaxID=2716340 RepID=UPI00146A7CDA|nr:RNA methyltransferase [Rhodococcus sp. HNM0569]